VVVPYPKAGEESSLPFAVRNREQNGLPLLGRLKSRAGGRSTDGADHNTVSRSIVVVRRVEGHGRPSAVTVSIPVDEHSDGPQGIRRPSRPKNKKVAIDARAFACRKKRNPSPERRWSCFTDKTSISALFQAMTKLAPKATNRRLRKAESSLDAPAVASLPIGLREFSSQVGMTAFPSML
jgi:hypothetical protein